MPRIDSRDFLRMGIGAAAGLSVDLGAALESPVPGSSPIQATSGELRIDDPFPDIIGRYRSPNILP